MNLLGYMAENVIVGDCDVVDPSELAELADAGWLVVDVRTGAEHLAGAIPGCQAEFIEGAGHMWVFEHTTDVLDALFPSNA